MDVGARGHFVLGRTLSSAKLAQRQAERLGPNNNILVCIFGHCDILATCLQKRTCYSADQPSRSLHRRWGDGSTEEGSLLEGEGE
jgi:hypothetical protein